MPPIIIRPARPGDLAPLVRMISALSAYHGDEATVSEPGLARDLFGPEPWVRVLVAEAEGELLGYAMLLATYSATRGARGMELHHLFVAEGCRDAGLGRRLVEAARALAAALGCVYLTVGTHPDNAGAQRLYAALGFERAPAPGPRFRCAIPAW